jgi:hypothetical protein
MVEETLQEALANETVEQETQEVQKEVEQTPQEPEESIQAKNFRELREQAKEYKRAALAQERAVLAQQQEIERIKKQLEESQKAKEYDYSDDELVERKHLKKTQKEIDDKLSRYEQKLVEQEQQLNEQYVLAKCPDFYAVVTDDTIKKLREKHPELAAAANSAGSTRACALSAYKLIKKFVLDDVDKEYEKKKILENSKKPKPVQQTPLAHAHSFEKRMTEKERAEFYSQMVDFSKKA